MLHNPTVSRGQAIARTLGVHGWDHLDALMLASLATQSPLLLVGAHGTAKSLLVERVATALGLDWRHYNAALLNYDDLVGIPLPDETNNTLRFVTTPGTIWDAGFVFFDEISRCRADLANKLFPIIHERRVVGIDLENLQHRWAAMNPPAPDEIDAGENASSYYLGSEPLDPALTDRFPFIVRVPTWAELSDADRRKLVSHELPTGVHTDPDYDLAMLVEDCAAMIPALEIEFEDWLADYIVSLVNILEQGGLPQSPRRARMLARSAVAIHAARVLLEGDDADVEESAELAVLFGVPQTATDVPPSEVKLVAIHKQAWELAQYLDDDNWRQVLSEPDHAQRVALADSLGFSDEDMSRLITQTLSVTDSDARQIGLATAMFLAFGTRRNLDPSAYEPLAQLSVHVMQPRGISANVVNPSQEATNLDEILQWVDMQHGRANSMIFRLERNFLHFGWPNLWRNEKWQDALKQFREDLHLFGIKE